MKEMDSILNVELYSKCCDKYNELYKKTKELYDNNVNSSVWKEKLTEQVDIRPLYSNKEYEDYQLKIKEDISLLINEKSNERVKEIIEVHIEHIEFLIGMVTLDTIGTTLNAMREFYHDLKIALLRIKNTEN